MKWKNLLRKNLQIISPRHFKIKWEIGTSSKICKYKSLENFTKLWCAKNKGLWIFCCTGLVYVKNHLIFEKTWIFRRRKIFSAQTPKLNWNFCTPGSGKKFENPLSFVHFSVISSKNNSTNITRVILLFQKSKKW